MIFHDLADVNHFQGVDNVINLVININYVAGRMGHKSDYEFARTWR